MPYILIFIIPILLLIPMAAAIVYHLKRYGLEGDSSGTLANIFLIVSLALLISAGIAFSRIDWTALQNLTFFTA